MTKIDITKPLEAVCVRDGKVVPVTFRRMETDLRIDLFTTKETPSDDTNQFWRLDGTDNCSSQLWTIRNRSENLDLTRPMQMRNGTAVTLLSDKATGNNPLVFQVADTVIVFSRPLHGRCYDDSHDMPIDVINLDVETREKLRLNTASLQIGTNLAMNKGVSIIIEVIRTNGKVTDVTFVEAGDHA